MTEKKISVIHAAQELGLRKQSLFKILKRLKIEVTREKSENHAGQSISYISEKDLKLVSDQVKYNANFQNENKPENGFTSKGVFYLIQLEPDHDPGRFKLGFATAIQDRLRQHRCAAPFAKVIATWPCHILWEKTAIDSITQGCEKIHTEVFRTIDISEIENRCNRFFEMMPSPEKL